MKALGGGRRSPLDMGDRPAEVQPGRRVSYVPSAALLVRRSALPEDPFDPALRYGEDVDLIWRLIDAGWRVRYEPGVVVHHEEDATLHEEVPVRDVGGATRATPSESARARDPAPVADADACFASRPPPATCSARIRSPYRAARATAALKRRARAARTALDRASADGDGDAVRRARHAVRCRRALRPPRSETLEESTDVWLDEFLKRVRRRVLDTPDRLDYQAMLVAPTAGGGAGNSRTMGTVYVCRRIPTKRGGWLVEVTLRIM